MDAVTPHDRQNSPGNVSEVSRDALPPKDALRQIELMFESANAVIRLAGIHWNRDSGNPREEHHGRLDQLAPIARDLNNRGYNIYVRGQPTSGASGKHNAATDADVTAINCLFVDYDNNGENGAPTGVPLPKPEECHLPYDFALAHDENGKWWLNWAVGDVEVHEFRGLQERLAARYQTDASVTNPSRLVRLAGYDRWENKKGGKVEMGKPQAPYRLVEGSGKLTHKADHDRLLPQVRTRDKAERTAQEREPDTEERERVEGFLAYIPPGNRADWFKVIAILRDPNIVNIVNGGTPLDETERKELLDDWCSGKTWKRTPADRRLPAEHYPVGSYQGWDDVEQLADAEGRERDLARFNSIVHDAEEKAKARGVTIPDWLLHPKPKFQPVAKVLPSGGKEWTAGRFRIADDDAQEHLREPDWAIPGLLPDGGYMLLAADRGSFKTFIAMDIALSIVVGSGEGTGRLWGEVRSTGPVLFAVGEGRPNLQKRRAAWEAKHNGGQRARGFFLADPVPRAKASEAEWDAFIALAKQAQPGGYKLVVLDTIGRSMQGGNINASEDAGLFTALVEKLQRELGTETNPCAVLALGHMGHGDKSRIMGAVEFEAAADTVLTVRRTGKQMFVELAMTKQKDGTEWEESRIVHLTEVGGSLAATSEAPAVGSEAIAAPEAESSARSKNDPRGPAPAILDAADEAAAAVMRANPSKAWSANDLGMSIANRLLHAGNEGVTERYVIRTLIPALREDRIRAVFRCFAPATRQYRWTEPKARKAEAANFKPVGRAPSRRQINHPGTATPQ